MITIKDLIELWKTDGYDLSIEWSCHKNNSTWTLYYTTFKYKMYEYRRHYCVLIESVEDRVKRSRILEFRMSDDINSMIHEAENLMELNWGDELYETHK